MLTSADLNATMVDRFLSKVDIPEDAALCWNWTGSTVKGYGQISNGIKHKSLRSHVVSYLLFKGEVGDKCVLHRCDNPRCVNPDHLFLGTVLDNVRDMHSKGRNHNVRGEAHGGAKISKTDALTIREMYGKTPTDKLMADYELSRTQVWRIAKGLRWAA